MTGELPWQFLGRSQKEEIANMKRLARTTGRPELLENCPDEFDTIFETIDEWNFYSIPDYNGVIFLFYNLFYLALCLFNENNAGG